jgi:hypothetical protein
VHKNQAAVESVRETYRRSAGQTPRLGLADLTAYYEKQLDTLASMSDFRHARVMFDADEFVPKAVRERYALLPSSVPVRDREVEIHYDVEETPEGNVGVARLRLPEKVARNLTEEELPALDRPLRFIVTRGARGAARANTLEELQDELARPFTEKEIEEIDRSQDQKRERHRHGRGKDRGRERGNKRRGDDRRATSTGDDSLRDDRRPRDEGFDGRREKPRGPGRFKPPRGGGKRRRG